MKNIKYLLFVTILFPLSLLAQETYKTINTKTEYTNPHPHKVETYKQKKGATSPKNIILMISDGMGPAQFHAALTANHGQLFIQNMKYMGMSKTSSTDQYITDSAAGGTALSAGQKTHNGAIAVDDDTLSIPTILEQAEEINMATGLVATSAITHATPASFIAHQKKRSMYEEIATDFLKTDIDVFIGGGYNHFGRRKSDNRNLITELEDKGYTVAEDLDDVIDFSEGRLAVLADSTHLPKYIIRGDMLPTATEKAIEVLHNNSKKGFFLMVEGSQIDWGGHQNDISYVVEEMLDFDRAVGKALEFAAKDGNTLVIVTADHETGGITIQGGDEEKGYIKAAFACGHHTGIAVPVFAFGPGADQFMGIYENTEIYHKMAKLLNLE